MQRNSQRQTATKRSTAESNKKSVGGAGTTQGSVADTGRSKMQERGVPQPNLGPQGED